MGTLRFHVFWSKLTASLDNTHHLHTARLAKLHELSPLLAGQTTGPSLLLGIGPHSQVLRVQSAPTRPELGNLLVTAPTRGGKGLLAVSQIHQWPHSLIVNDIKGELFQQTAGHRATLGPVYVIDPNGVGNSYDPLLTKHTEKDLLTAATTLLYDPDDREPIFRQRAAVMLAQLFLAARLVEAPPLPYVRYMVRLGLVGAATKLHLLSPELATQFLDCELRFADFKDKFLESAWSTLSTRMRIILSDTVVKSFGATDFTAKEIMQSDKPITVYLRWPERDLLSLAPLVRSLWSSLIGELIHTYDSANGVTCKPVLLLVDEAGRTAIPSLADHATTINGRGISLWLAVQSLSQLDTIYGRSRGQTLRDNMDSQIYYRPNDQKTADYIAERIGYKSGFAHSESEHGDYSSKGASEQRVYVMTPQRLMQLPDTALIGFHRNLRPFAANRMDWRYFATLRHRTQIPPPRIPSLHKLEFISDRPHQFHVGVRYQMNRDVISEKPYLL